MNTIKIIEKIISLPTKFKERDNEKSIHTLLYETNYFDSNEQIDESNIYDVLSKKQDKYIQEWLEWSANKRTDEGWYLLAKRNKYVVGYSGMNTDKKQQLEFFSSEIACAVFIKREIEHIRTS